MRRWPRDPSRSATCSGTTPRLRSGCRSCSSRCRPTSRPTRSSSGRSGWGCGRSRPSTSSTCRPAAGTRCRPGCPECMPCPGTRRDARRQLGRPRFRRPSRVAVAAAAPPPLPPGRGSRPARPVLRRAGAGRRLNASLLSLGIALTLFAGRLVQLQGVHWSQYRNLAQQQMLPPQPFPSPVVRGSISSSDGTILAMTVQTDLVYADPPQIPQAKRPQAAAALAGPLGMTPSAIQALIDHPTSPDYVVLKRGVPAATGARITALTLPGIFETSTYSRSYPNGDLASNLIGFANPGAAGDLQGQAGLEAPANSLPRGRAGLEQGAR